MSIASRTLRVLAVTLFLGAGPAASAVRADAYYQVTDLGRLIPNGLTNSGQVLESYYVPSATSPSGLGYTSVLYSSYGPTAGQQDPLPIVGTAMSANGTVSGYVGSPSGSSGQAEIYNVNTPNTPPTPIVTNFPGTAGVLPNNVMTGAVNDSGQVVGAAFTLGPGYVPGNSYISNTEHAFVSSGGTITDLGTLGGSTQRGECDQQRRTSRRWFHAR